MGYISCRYSTQRGISNTADILLYSMTVNIKHISENFCSNIVLLPTDRSPSASYYLTLRFVIPAAIVFFRRVKAEVKLFLYKPWRQLGGAVVWLHSFLTFTPRGFEWSGLCRGSFRLSSPYNRPWWLRGGLKVWLYSFFNFGVIWGARPTPRSGCFTRGKESRYPSW
jgi:hypothetical protein